MSQAIIVTGDRDLLQVVEDKIWVLTSGRKFSDTIIYDRPKVRERYQLEPRPTDRPERRWSETNRTTSPACTAWAKRAR